MLTIAAYAATTAAWLRLRAGEWGVAERATRRELDSGIVVRLHATTVLTELAVRRGDPDASERLTELAHMAERSGELQRIVPILELETERALTSGASMPTERIDKLLAEIQSRGAIGGRFGIRVAACAALAGLDIELEQPVSGPHAAMAGGTGVERPTPSATSDGPMTGR